MRPSGDLVRSSEHPTTLEVTSVFVYDGAEKIAQYGNALASWEAVWGAGMHQLLEWRELGGQGASTYVPLVDHRNSVVGLWSADALALVASAEYDPNGRMRVRDGADTVTCTEEGNPGQVCRLPGSLPFGFGSLWRSERTGLVQMGHRWYAPRLTQFDSHDPLGYVDSYNLYAYAAFDPINGWDPWGLQWQSYGPYKPNNFMNVVDIRPGQPATSYPGQLAMPPEMEWTLRAMAADKFQPNGKPMERMALISRSYEVHVLNKDVHISVMTPKLAENFAPSRGTLAGHAIGDMSVLYSSDIHVHSHPDNSGPSTGDLALATGRPPPEDFIQDLFDEKMLVVSDPDGDMWLLIATDQARKAKNDIPIGLRKHGLYQSNTELVRRAIRNRIDQRKKAGASDIEAWVTTAWDAGIVVYRKTPDDNDFVNMAKLGFAR